MIKKIIKLFSSLWPQFKITSTLTAENLALRQQLAIMQRSSKKPSLRIRDRLFWVFLSRFWGNWKETLIIVKPDTVVRWHRKGFKLFWKLKSRSKGPGRPKISPESGLLFSRWQKPIRFGVPPEFTVSYSNWALIFQSERFLT